ncbi:MAG: ammonium transporter, Amt family [Desulfomicrobiaceae bacterium]|jgi:Amt family ammonium transporter|nr:ammonium transporter, Amt family [Desulfomicrobiaceae bacterium]
MDAADTGFVLMSAALVMFMTPGLALFYGGMVRAKNVLATLMQSFILLGLVSVLWAVVGYTLAFGTDVGGVIGALNHLLLAGVGGDAPEGWTLTIPPAAFMIFQCMFAVITPALITGAFAERMRFAPFLVFSGLWLVLVYCPMAHWVWGGAAGWARWGLWTSPVGPWCICAQPRRPWPAVWSSARGAGSVKRPTSPTTSP